MSGVKCTAVRNETLSARRENSGSCDGGSEPSDTVCHGCVTGADFSRQMPVIDRGQTSAEVRLGAGRRLGLMTDD